MQIDWVTTIAQIINFAVLLWLLRRFLYRPIIDAVDRRETEIRNRLADAASRAADAQAGRDEIERQRELMSEEREVMLKQARHDADQLRTALRKAFRDEVETDRKNLQKSLAAERRAFSREIAGVAIDRLSALAGKVLFDLADMPLERQILSAFISELSAIEGPEKQKLSRALAKHGATISSSRPLTRSEKQRLQRAVSTLSAAKSATRFQTDPSLQSGLRLRAGGQVLEWSLDRYLQEFETALVRGLDVPDSEAAAAPSNKLSATQDEPQKNFFGSLKTVLHSQPVLLRMRSEQSCFRKPRAP